MAKARPKIPAELKRQVLLEAGHQCAIPTCKKTPVEIAHIVPWSRVKSHKFENLIALCPACHARYDRTKEIDRKSIRQYKVNLGILNQRYTDTERQLMMALLEMLRKMNKDFQRRGWPPYRLCEPGLVGDSSLRISADMWWVVSNLLEDGLIELRQEGKEELTEGEWLRGAQMILITEKGREFLEHWVNADPL
ncbi:HNH endonuclease signature motif containing protein [Streptomyces sp. NPDC006976]|uniref:HNH endonuclease n=1 Tax=Streptomyces sp. NPDC006976 TaxID=3154311 RepID=UPI0033CA7A42